MKKLKIIIILLLPILLLSTGCEKKQEPKDEIKEIEFLDQKLNYKTTFQVEKGSSFSDIKKDENSGSSEVFSFRNEKLDVFFEMYYNVIRLNTYESLKNSRKEKKFYKEFSLGNYQGYGYSDSDDKVYLNILLSQEDNTVIVLFVSMERIDDNNKIILLEVFEEEEIQNLLKSITFEKVNNS